MENLGRSSVNSNYSFPLEQKENISSEEPENQQVGKVAIDSFLNKPVQTNTKLPANSKKLDPDTKSNSVSEKPGKMKQAAFKARQVFGSIWGFTKRVGRNIGRLIPKEPPGSYDYFSSSVKSERKVSAGEEVDKGGVESGPEASAGEEVDKGGVESGTDEVEKAEKPQQKIENSRSRNRLMSRMTDRRKNSGSAMARKRLGKPTRAPPDLKQMAKEMRAATINMEKNAMSSWGEVRNQDGEVKESPAPDIESKNARGKQLHLVDGVEVSTQVKKDFTRPIEVVVKRDGVEDTGWDFKDKDNNTVDKLFEKVRTAIKATSGGDELDENSIDELIHIALEGATQTFDAVLLQEANTLAAENKGGLGANGVPQVTIQVGRNSLTIEKRQPMRLMLMDLEQQVPLDIKRAFSVDMRTGECKQLKATMVYEWGKTDTLK